MKKILIILMTIAAQFVYGQKKIDLFEEDEKIKLLLHSNLKSISYPDSIALFSFYIKITPHKDGNNSIYNSNPLANKVYGDIDSLFRGVDFNIFFKNTKQKHVIIPIGILLYAHNNTKPKEKFDIWELHKGMPKMMADDDRDRYKSVFLKPILMFISTEVIN